MVVFSTLRGCLAMFSTLRDCLGWIFGLLGMLSYFEPTHCPEFGTVFGWGMEEIWSRILYRSCICNCELNVRLLNHPNWTSTAQVMVHFILETVTTYAI